MSAGKNVIKAPDYKRYTVFIPRDLSFSYIVIKHSCSAQIPLLVLRCCFNSKL